MNRIVYPITIILFLLISIACRGQIITTIVGSGYGIDTGDGGMASAAGLSRPYNLALDRSGNLFILDSGFVIRKVNTSGIISTFAGTGIPGYSGDGGPATSAKFGNMNAIVADTSGNVIVADLNRIRKINTAGIVTTIAGTGAWGFSGDGGPATNAKVEEPGGVTIDPAGNIYISDANNHRIRKINVLGIISTIAGNGTPAFSGDGGPASAAEVYQPTNIICDRLGNIYFIDFFNYRIRKIDADGIISTVAGNGISATTGDGGPATSSEIFAPTAMTMDTSGNIYIATDNFVRKINTAGIITTIAGSTFGYSGDGGPATNAGMKYPYGVAVDLSENVYISDYDNHRIRKVVNCTPPVASIAGPISQCSGTSVTFTDAPAGGIWSSSDTTVLSIDSAGVATGNVAGIATINYRVVTACGSDSAVKTITVNSIVPYITPITGPSTICTGNTTTLSNAVTGGVWNSSNTSIATITSTGVLNAITHGTDTVRYIVTNSCGSDTAYHAIMVNQPPNAGTISGPSVICETSTITLTDTATSGVWSSSNNALATVTSSGVVNAVSSGIDTIKYIVTNSCGSDSAIKTITINPIIPYITPITGLSTICIGNTTTLSNAVTGGIWSSTNTSLATITTSGLLSTLAVGMDTVRYVVSNSCSSDTVYHTIIVNPLPNAGSIAGVSTVCESAITTLSDTATGGIWSSSNNAVATITSSGVVDAISAGIDTIKYKVINSCGSDSTIHAIIVNPLPHAGNISGISTICATNTTTLSDTAAGGVWSSSNTSIATISAIGVLNAISQGTDTIKYVVTNSCGSDSTFHIITVNPLPGAGAISGVSAMCEGTTTTLVDTAITGTWSSSNNTIATVTSMGVVDAISPGIDTIKYKVTNSCGSDSAIHPITVTPLPHAGNISGLSTICTTNIVTLSDTATGGVWSSTNTSIATISATGVLNAISQGTDTIKYVVTNSCGSDSTFHIITVNPLPDAGAISGASVICETGTITLTDTATGGTWTSSNNAIITVTSSGVVNGINVGIDTIKYKVTNSCGSDSTMHPITVNPLPHAGNISGATDLCAGSTATLTDTATGGTWSSTNTATATVNSLGMVTAITSGTTLIKYSVTNSCGTDSTTHPLMIHTLSAGLISGSSSVCAGSVTTLGETVSGGTWTSSNTSVATVSTSGIVTALAPGTTFITYSVADSFCASSVFDTLVVYPVPGLSSSLTPPAICDKLPFVYIPSSSVAGATFSWTRAAINGIDAATMNGIDSVDELLNDTTSLPITVTYVYVTSANGCVDTQNVVVVVNPAPVLISSLSDTLCSGTTFNYTPLSSVTGSIFTWTRPTVTGISPVGTTGVNNIAETLTNTTTTPIQVPYTYDVTVYGCTDTQSVLLTVNPAVAKPEITTKPRSVLCNGVLYMNFGTALPAAPGVQYHWSTFNGATIWATGLGAQYCLVNYTTPGIAWVYLSATTADHLCNSSDSFAVAVTLNDAEIPEIIRFNNDFVCEQNNVATYQWGYDDAITLDSTILTGETNQHYYNEHPDLAGKYYWVITTRNDCMQKAYYNTPTGVANSPQPTEGEISMYPNPTTGVFTIKLSGQKSTAVVTITDIYGKIIEQRQLVIGVDKTDFDLSDKARGTYLVTVEAGNITYREKVVKW